MEVFLFAENRGREHDLYRRNESMPIKVNDQLSAVDNLRQEGIVTITEQRAHTQDIRPLRILILNLMPLKKPTELMLLRLLGNSPIQIEVDFCRTVTHEATHTDNSYLDSAYLEFQDIKDRYYDGFLVTGAPVECYDFEDVDYWQEFTEYMEWAKRHVFSVLYYCWGAQAGLYYHYGIQKHLLPKKFSGIYQYDLTMKYHPLLRGFDDRYFIPQSRHTDIDHAAVESHPALTVLSRSSYHGVNIVTAEDIRRVFVLGHFEYNRRTLEEEFVRDRDKGLHPAIPKYYYPENDPSEPPVFKWCSYAHLFYSNWINLVYQNTPYDLHDLQPLP